MRKQSVQNINVKRMMMCYCDSMCGMTVDFAALIPR